ncbi:uncharacterized protein [Dysidea avara]|uniref:uncharacterized protein n=1 Tax=Dysidea avara TaxID=196820 RepID=UPI00332117A8
MMVSLKMLVLLFCFLGYVVHGLELPPGVLECGQVPDVVLQKQSHNSLSIDCPFVVDISTFTDDSTAIYIPSSVYTIKLYSNASNMAEFSGFRIQGRSLADDQPVGTFISSPIDYQLHCEDHSAATHYNDKEKKSVSLMWEPPPPGTGAVRFRYTVVKDNSTFWIGLYTGPILEGATVAKRQVGGTVNNAVTATLTTSEQTMINMFISTMDMNMPTSTTSTSMPTSTTSTSTPTSTTRMNMPTSTTSTSMPTSTTSMNMPTSTTSMNMPTSTTSMNMPTSTTSMNIPTSTTSMTTPPVGTGGNSKDDDELSAGAIAGILIGILVFFVIVAGVLAGGMSLWWYHKKTSRTVKVSKIVPDKRPLVVQPAVQMTHMSNGRHP